MSVTALGSSTSTNTNTSSAMSAQTVDYQSFLRLLVAQMKNQDPTSPMESTDYVAQLATFSQVEQSVQMNSNLQSMLQASTLSQATGLIGRYIESMDGSVAGYVKEVQVYSDGSVLVLDDGTLVPMGTSMTVTETKPAEDTGTDDTADTETGTDEQEA